MSPGAHCMTLFDSTVDATVMDDHWLDFLDEELIVGENKNHESNMRSTTSTTGANSHLHAETHKLVSNFCCDEESDAVALKLLEFDREMLKVSPNEAYLKALRLNPDYVTNKEFRMMFLRSQKFDVHAAATQMAHHFETKRRLFGDLVLERDIRQSDLSAQDLKVLALGAIQAFPHRDSANRPVVAIFWDLISKNNISYGELARPLFYFFMKLAESVEAQRLGMVWVMYSNSSSGDFSSLLNAQTQVCCSVPSWVAAVHICGETLAPQPLKTDSSARFGVRQHTGSALEVAFQLLVFGIRTSEGPMGTDGVWTTSRHKQWLDRLKGSEEATRKRVQQQHKEHSTSTGASSSSKKIVPEKFDILLGRTKRSLHHTGNSRMIQLCEMHFEVYDTANKLRKTQISDQIVSLIHESGGRFLKWDEEKGNGKWVLETDLLVARNKVAHCFRHVRARFARGGTSVVSPESSPSPSSHSSSLDYLMTPKSVFFHEETTTTTSTTAKRPVEQPTREQPARRSQRARNNY